MIGHETSTYLIHGPHLADVIGGTKNANIYVENQATWPSALIIANVPSTPSNATVGRAGKRCASLER
jgi:hypothetical protein